MSAFVVSKHDIDILVTAHLALNGCAYSNERADAIGRTLWRENANSVRYRYSHWTRPELEAAWPDLKIVPFYEFKPVHAKAAAVAKIARCYDYQSCEHPAYEASQAKAIADTLMATFPETLPGYDDAPWGIADDADLARARV